MSRATQSGLFVVARGVFSIQVSFTWSFGGGILYTCTFVQLFIIVSGSHLWVILLLVDSATGAGDGKEEGVGWRTSVTTADPVARGGSVVPTAAFTGL